MKAIHIRTSGQHDEYECAFCEMIIRLVDGVKDVASIRTLHLISVLYDDTVADVSQILGALRQAGFGAYVYNPDTRVARPAATAGIPQ